MSTRSIVMLKQNKHLSPHPHPSPVVKCCMYNKMNPVVKCCTYNKMNPVVECCMYNKMNPCCMHNKMNPVVECCVYHNMNAALRQLDLVELAPYLPFMKLLLTALYKLPLQKGCSLGFLFLPFYYIYNPIPREYNILFSV